MQHKNNSTGQPIISHLSTKEKEVLKRKLPTDWVERVQTKVNYSAAAIRDVLRLGKIHPVIMPSIVEVAEEYQLEVAVGVEDLKGRITKLTES